MISLDAISTCRLHSLQDQWGVGALSEVIEEQQLQAEESISQSGVGESLDIYA